MNKYKTEALDKTDFVPKKSRFLIEHCVFLFSFRFSLGSKFQVFFEVENFVEHILFMM